MDWKLDAIIDRAFEEDMPFGDISTESLSLGSAEAEAILTSKQSGVIAGIDVAINVFQRMDESLWVERYIEDGVFVEAGTILLRVRGAAGSLLKAERTALNLIQHMSGIASITRQFVDVVEGTGVRIVDTRKTTPGLRFLEKYAVRAGGGRNHRFSLSDAVMLKDNHIAAAGGIREAVQIVRNQIPHTMKIEVETETLNQVAEAVEIGADIIMLDNMAPEMMREAVRIIGGKAVSEASGGISLDTIRTIAETGVDVISVGALTHSAPNLDISMKLKLLK